MAGSISRRRLADHVADRLIANDASVISQLAAYLIDARKIRTLDLVVRDIESALTQRGVLVADVTSAHELTESVRKDIRTFLSQAGNVRTVHLRESVDASLIGGVHIETPEATLDTTIKNKLQQLKAAKQ